jgi:ferredoxin
MNLLSQRIGLNQWSYDNGYFENERKKVPHYEFSVCKTQLNLEVELGFDEKLALEESKRCLNCDVQPIFEADLCIECDACVDICPTKCLTISPDSEDAETFKRSLKSYPKNESQELFASKVPQTDRLMVKDENLCLHCGLCAERCPTAAWDMQAFALVK